MLRKILFLCLLLFIAFSDCVNADNAEIKSKIEELNKTASALNSEIEKMEADKKIKTDELAEVNSNLAELQGKMNSLETEINQNSSMLEEAEKSSENSYDTFAKRLRIMYEQGENVYIELLLGSENIKDLMDRIEMIREISSNDAEVYKSFLENEKNIQEKQNELSNLRMDYAERESDFNQLVSSKSNEINTLINDINSKKAEYDDIQSQISNLEKQMVSVDYADKLFAEAEKYIGMPYVFGGSSPETSFDCSGFVCYAVTHSGVHNLPRTTAQGIYNQCIKISESEAKRGDIIFFQGTYNAGETVTHVGFYAGDGKMLHCGDPIQYTSIHTPYWESHFYAYGRLK